MLDGVVSLQLPVLSYLYFEFDLIITFGNLEEQKKKYVVPLAKGQKLGCFGLTSQALVQTHTVASTKAVLDGDDGF